MALPEASEQPDKKPTADPAPKGLQDKNKLHSKVVVRRLPPNMDKETFLNQVSPVPHYDYMYMVKGDASLGEHSFARAYINFTHHNDIYDFKEKFDNYVFLDAAGHEYPAVVEFAAFQKIPKRRNKARVDPKVGSIETDPYYLEFVEMLNKPPEKDDQKPEYSYQITTENKNDTMTPLLEYIKNKRAERLRIREERREERKRKEFERKKYREDERKKRFDSPAKAKGAKPKDKDQSEDGDKAAVEEQAKKPEVEEAVEKSSSYYKNRKFEDKKKDVKGKYPPPRKEYVDKREYKNSRRSDEYKEREYGNKPKYDDYKKDTGAQKKVKKYSEKREERKLEAQKAEQQKKHQQQQEKEGKDPGGDGAKNVEEVPKESSKEKKEKPKQEESKPAEVEAKPIEKKSSESQSSRRIRNKDRPTIAIYRPGMLSKRKQPDSGEGDSSKKD